jgi:TolA-binding protein
MAQRKKKSKKKDEVLIDITEVTGQAEDFFEKYQKQIMIGVTALVVIVGGYLSYRNLVIKPKQREVTEQMAQAEWQFGRDSFALALANPGAGFPGFADIVKNYGGTTGGNAALYYAGICCLNMGQFDAAISYLEDFSASGELTPAMKYGALGDAYAEKGDLGKALGLYKKAANENGNEVITPYFLKKVALLSEKQGKPGDAKAAWSKIKSEYPGAPEAGDAEKYLVRLK